MKMMTVMLVVVVVLSKQRPIYEPLSIDRYLN